MNERRGSDQDVRWRGRT